MGDSGSEGRPSTGHLNNYGNSPLRIFTRTNSEGSKGEMVTHNQESSGQSLSAGAAYSLPNDEANLNELRITPPPFAQSANGSNRGQRKAGKFIPKVSGRHGTQYHPLPSYWRELDSGSVSSPASSGLASPVTPDSGGNDELFNGPRSLPYTSQLPSSSPLNSEITAGSGGAFPVPRETPGRTARTIGHSPSPNTHSPRTQLGALREAFDSASSLGWGERPGSSYSYHSIEQAQSNTQQDSVCESPLESSVHRDHNLPLSSLGAARYGIPVTAVSSQQQQKQLGATGQQSGNNMFPAPPAHILTALGGYSGEGDIESPISPMVRPSTANSGSTDVHSKKAGDASDIAIPRNDDIVRKWLVHQRRLISGGKSLQPPIPQPQHSAAPDTFSAGPTSNETNSANAINKSGKLAIPPSLLGEIAIDQSGNKNLRYRRALSSSDIAILEDNTNGNGGAVDNRNLLAPPDLVASPLEALVRRLTAELFQLYVSEDRKKKQNGSKDSTLSAAEKQDNDISYIQQFRFGPSQKSGSTTPAVTLDGYFRSKPAVVNDIPVRPRHRLVQRTWVEEALIKARRVSTIDEHAEESILNGLENMLSGFSAPTAGTETSDRNQSVATSPSGPENVSQFNSPAPSQGIVSKSSQIENGSSTIYNGAHFDSADKNIVSAPDANRRRATRPKLHLGKMAEEIHGVTDPRTALLMNSLSDNHPKSPRGFYRARDPAAPHRKPMQERIKMPYNQHLAISPARASLLRAVGRRQSIRLQPEKGQIMVTETLMGGTPGSGDDSTGSSENVSEDGNITLSPTDFRDDPMFRKKRSNSLPDLINIPETKEISYKKKREEASRNVVLLKCPNSRARTVHRAERMILGGSLSNNTATDKNSESPDRKRHRRARAATKSHVGTDSHLVIVELPPPVPLRVRREQVKALPEPLIIVRKPAVKSSVTISQGRNSISAVSGDLTSALPNALADEHEQEIMNLQNQLLGAQAVLSRHNTGSGRRNITPTSIYRNAPNGSPNVVGHGAAFGSVPPKTAAHSRNGSTSTATAVSRRNKQAAANQRQMRNAVRNEALDVVMLDYAVDDRIDEDVNQSRARRKQRHDAHNKTNDENGKVSETDATDDAQQPRGAVDRRTTLRRRWRSQKKRMGASERHGMNLPRPVDWGRRRLLLHGPAYRIYSGIKAKSDTYLFLFSDVLVVTTRILNSAASHSGMTIANDYTGLLSMAQPSSDMHTVPTDSRYRVHIAIPLIPQSTNLILVREGGSKRAGEDDEAEERRIVRQDERIRRACHTFEKNTSEAVVYLIHRNIIDPKPENIAGFLYRCTALSRRQIGHFLGSGILGENLHDNPTVDEINQEKQFHRHIWTAFLERCNVTNVPIDEALRSALFYVRLPNNPRAISVLLEILALHWYAKNAELASNSQVHLKFFFPDSQDVAVKLAFAIMSLNAELHNPLLRDEVQPDAAFRDMVAKFRGALVDDPVFSGKRKGNVLRKKDQPRVVTIMEVPKENLKEIFDRVMSSRLVTSSDARPSAPEFDVDWIRDLEDINGPALSDEQVGQEIDDVYCDPGFRDGILFNASSDRLPCKLNVDPPAWLRVIIRIPEPDSKFSILVGVINAQSPVSQQQNLNEEIVSIVPTPHLVFKESNAASFVIVPKQIGHFTLQFTSMGSHARYYHPIPSRSIVIEGAFMRHTIQVNFLKTSNESQNHKARHMFGMESEASKNQWSYGLETALNNNTSVGQKALSSSIDKAIQKVAGLASPSGTASTAEQTVSGSRAGAGDWGSCVSSLDLLQSLVTL